MKTVGKKKKEIADEKKKCDPTVNLIYIAYANSF